MNPELALGTTEHEGPEAGGAELKTASPADPPLTLDEFDAIVAAVWADLEADPFRIGDLLADALGFIGAVALAFDTDPAEAARAAAVLRAMEQRALWGPDHEQEDHR